MLGLVLVLWIVAEEDAADAGLLVPTVAPATDDATASSDVFLSKKKQKNIMNYATIYPEKQNLKW